ncbi:MAG: ATP-binding cassette domain-containing protein [Clostridia bacterium]|nr:ATP-binding cassette domain-containing protein [Clostridia bacterium]
MDDTMPVVLSVQEATQRFGGVTAVNNVNLEVHRGDRYLLIGTNGAGKSTLFNLICGDLPLTNGKIVLFGQNVTHKSVRQRAALGMRRTYQATALFPKLTVRQNLYLAILGTQPLIKHFNLFKDYRDSSAYTEEIEKVAADVMLLPKVDERVMNLSHGEHRQLELGLALIAKPKLLLLDEPSSGLSENERALMRKMLLALDKEITLLMVEHNMELAFSVASRVTVMYDGEVVFEGTPEETQKSELVQSIYLGAGGKNQ